MLSIFEDDGFWFRIVDGCVSPRIHLAGVAPGRFVSVFKLDVNTRERMSGLSIATADGGGCVDMPQPRTVRGGDGFLDVPENTT